MTDYIVDNKKISKDSSNRLLAELMETAQKAHEENIVEYLKDTFRITNLKDLIYENENEAIIKICNNENTKRIEIVINENGVKINGFRELLIGENFFIKYQKEQRKIALYNGEKELTNEYLPRDRGMDFSVAILHALIDITSTTIPNILVETLEFSTCLDSYILTDSKSGILRAAPGLIGYTLTAPQKDKELSLNRPDKEMLSKLIIPKKEIKDKEISKVADFIEKEVGGEVDIDTIGLFPEIYFKKGINVYPILRSHSGVRELAPLILYLRYVLEKKSEILVFEEPETHLHPYIQSVVTRALALLSKNISVLITTHSPIILDELNNLIKLNKLTQEDKEKAGYKENEGLKYESVYVYRFKLDGSVERVKIGEDGIYEDEFSSVVIELSNKYAEVEELLSKHIHEKPKNRGAYLEWKE